MLFNSLQFLFVFLPLALAAYALAWRLLGARGARVTLLAGSLFFYSWWDIRFVPILLTSYFGNYAFGLLLAAYKTDAMRRRILIVAIAMNLGALAYFKYNSFLVVTWNQMVGLDFDVPTALLPLGISFFTFHQITYLVYVYRTQIVERDPIVYGLFVLFFPQLLAGPITYAKEMIPQFKTVGSVSLDGMVVGLTIFSIGLFKKSILADGMAPIADVVFEAAAKGSSIDFFQAWRAAIAYSFQIYFDFSGYSDMAIGLARMFGYHLPINFFSPYKATNIVEFWRRWHISLSRFLRDYLYILLGGNRRGEARRVANLLITMLLGGLWHGAGWTFVIWGGLHGLYLVINHVWQVIAPRGRPTQIAMAIIGGPVTYIAVCIAWVFFRAESIAAAQNMLWAMLGGNGFDDLRAIMEPWWDISMLRWEDIALDYVAGAKRPAWSSELTLFVTCAVVTWCLPNIYQILGSRSKAIDTYQQLSKWSWLRWSPNLAWALISALAFTASLIPLFSYENPSRFLYFQF